MNTRVLSMLAISISMSGCAFLPSVKNKLDVRPVKYVPCWDNMGPNTACGSVTVLPENAEGFVVTVGWKKFAEITDQGGFSSIVNENTRNKFIDFSVTELVLRGYCKEAVVLEDSKVLGWEMSGDRGIYVVCASR